jgi:hypothetical protein
MVKKGEFLSTYYSDQRRCFLKSEGKEYFCKNGTGAKPNNINPKIWLMNEMLYSVFAEKIDLPIPEVKFLEHNNILYVGSEYLHDRVAFNLKPKDNALQNLPNKIILTKIFLLDIFLFNSDRYGWNILVDKVGKVWAIDHDKCFMGDGVNDTHRFNNLKEKRLQYILDYIPYNLLNIEVLDPANLGRLSDFAKQIAYILRLVTLEEIADKMPTEIFDLINKNYFEKLKVWVNYVADFFDNKENIVELVIILNSREKK